MESEEKRNKSCPSCETETPLKKSWVIQRGKGSEKTTWRIFLYTCPKCGRSFRKAKPESKTSKGVRK